MLADQRPLGPLTDTDVNHQIDPPPARTELSWRESRLMVLLWRCASVFGGLPLAFEVTAKIGALGGALIAWSSNIRRFSDCG